MIAKNQLENNVILWYYSYGEKNGRDGYIGLTDLQWKELSRRYSEFIETTYNKKYKFENIIEFVDLISESGFSVVDIKKLDNKDLDDDKSDENKGHFAFLIKKN